MPPLGGTEVLLLSFPTCPTQAGAAWPCELFRISDKYRNVERERQTGCLLSQCIPGQGRQEGERDTLCGVGQSREGSLPERSGSEAPDCRRGCGAGGGLISMCLLQAQLFDEVNVVLCLEIR